MVRTQEPYNQQNQEVDASTQSHANHHEKMHI